MKILALEREELGLTAADFEPHLKAEAARVWELVKAGIVREVYFNPLEHTVVAVLECADLDEARRTLEEMPLVQRGLIHFEYIPLMPYTGFERLFTPDARPASG